MIHTLYQTAYLTITRYCPAEARRHASLPTAVRWRQKSRHTGPQSAHLWWPVVAKLQAASVPVAYAAAQWDRQIDGEIALFQNAPLGWGA